MCLAIGSTTPPSNNPVLRLLRGIGGNPFSMLSLGALLFALSAPWLQGETALVGVLLLSGLIAQPMLGYLFARLPPWYRQSPVLYLSYMLVFWAWAIALICAWAGWWRAALLLCVAGWWQAWRVLDDLGLWIPDAHVKPVKLLKMLALTNGAAVLLALASGLFVAPLAIGVGLLLATGLWLSWTFSRGCAAA